jgi:hemoglobin
MSMTTRRDPRDDASHPLPLTEAPARSIIEGAVSEADIRALVDAFYATVRDDDLLGKVFDHHVEDWSVHLPKMYDFWSTVALHSGRYSGRPLETHARLPELSRAHFARWLALWELTVDRTIAAPARGVFVIAAQRMAASMSSRLGLPDPA